MISLQTAWERHSCVPLCLCLAKDSSAPCFVWYNPLMLGMLSAVFVKGTTRYKVFTIPQQL